MSASRICRRPIPSAGSSGAGAEVVAGVRNGVISLEEACRRYKLSMGRIPVLAASDRKPRPRRAARDALAGLSRGRETGIIPAVRCFRPLRSPKLLGLNSWAGTRQILPGLTGRLPQTAVRLPCPVALRAIQSLIRRPARNGEMSIGRLCPDAAEARHNTPRRYIRRRSCDDCLLHLPGDPVDQPVLRSALFRPRPERQRTGRRQARGDERALRGQGRRQHCAGADRPGAAAAPDHGRDRHPA